MSLVRHSGFENFLDRARAGEDECFGDPSYPCWSKKVKKRKKKKKGYGEKK